MFNLLGNCQFSKIAAHFSKLPAMYQESKCSTSLSTLIIFLIKNQLTYPRGCKVVYHLALIYISLMINGDHRFMCLLVILCILFEKYYLKPLVIL
jgi:hypothetical protein